MLRLFLNFLITTGLLFLFNAWNWLTLSDNHVQLSSGNLTWPAFGSVVLVAVVLWLVGIAVEWLYVVSVVFTLGLMLLAFPFIGWAVLAGTAHFMPATLAVHGFWVTLLCGWLLLAVKLPKARVSSD